MIGFIKSLCSDENADSRLSIQARFVTKKLLGNKMLLKLDMSMLVVIRCRSFFQTKKYNSIRQATSVESKGGKPTGSAYKNTVSMNG